MVRLAASIEVWSAVTAGRMEIFMAFDLARGVGGVKQVRTRAAPLSVNSAIVL